MGVNIGQASKVSGLSQRMIRYFEKQGLIPTPERRDGGYRTYDDAEVRRMRIIALAQDVGFSTEGVARLLGAMDEQRHDRSPLAAADRVLALAELDLKALVLDDLRASISGEDMPRSDADDEDAVDWGPPPIRSVTRRAGAAIAVVRREADWTYARSKPSTGPTVPRASKATKRELIRAE